MKKWTTFEQEEQATPHAVLSVDVERSFASEPDIFRQSVRSMLDSFSSRNWIATCFVEGEALTWYPELLQELAAAGHEVGSHGYRHRDQRGWSRAELEEDLDRSLDEFQKAGVECMGYRAPYFLCHAELEPTLLSRGIALDSSLPRIWFPGRYDHRNISRFPFRSEGGLLRVPVACNRFWLPQSAEHHKVLRPFFSKETRGQSGVLYCHSYSFGEGYQRPWFNREENTVKTILSLEQMIGERPVIPIGRWLESTVL